MMKGGEPMDNNEYLNTAEALENMSKSLIEIKNALEPIAKISASIFEALQPLMEFLAEASKLVKRFYSQSIPNYTITNENSDVINIGVNDHCDISTAPPVKSCDIENQYNNCTINNYYADQSKHSFDWKFWLPVLIDIIAIALQIYLGVL